MNTLTPRILIEIVEHEAIVLEAYLDGGNVWTWSVGITNASGHQVYPRYKDKPQSLQFCLMVYVWLLRTKYLPDVLKAFEGRELSEGQLAAALSFHWNTGAILEAQWPKLWLAGKADEAQDAFLHYCHPPSIISRRKAERALFFEDRWIGDGKVIVWPVAKPSYHPDWKRPSVVDITAAVTAAMA